MDVITGLIKSNMPSRISFKTSSKVDSRTILDQNGAEALLGMGDMLFIPPNTATPLRAQCSYLEDDDINRVVEYVRAQRQPSYYQEIAGKSVKLPGIEEGENPEADPEDEAMYKDAVRVILENQRGSVSLLQRKMGLGYNKASRLVEMMEERGVVGPQRGSKPREVLFTLEEWDAMQDGVFAVSPAASTATEASEEDNYPDETGEESSELEASSNNETDDDEIGHEEEEPEVAKTGEPGGRNRAAD